MTHSGGLFSETTEESNKNKLIKKVIMIFGIFLVVVIAFFLFKGKPGSAKKKSVKIQQAQKLVNKINSLESSIMKRQSEVFSLISEYKKKTGRNLPAINMLNLSPQERQILQQKINEEQSVSIQSLLGDILKKNKAIAGLNVKMHEIEALLPKPTVVNKGQTHYQIARNFLENRGIETKEAKRLIERAALFDYLVPGFKVWNFHTENEFGTFVTQGTATISPNTIRRQAKRKLENDRDEAISAGETLAQEIDLLEKRKETLISQIAMLDQEKDELITKIGDLNVKNRTLQVELNSLFYLLETKDSLKKKGVLKGGGFLSSTRLDNFSPELFQASIDLRKENIINVSADAYKVKKINKIVVYPKFYKLNQDFNVVIDKTQKYAVLTILKRDKLKNVRLVISLE